MKRKLSRPLFCGRIREGAVREGGRMQENQSRGATPI